MKVHKKVNVPGAGKGNGTLRAYSINNRVHYWVEGYDPESANPKNIPGAVRLNARGYRDHDIAIKKYVKK
tara:strand:- start:96 stop:305 length:210 start_codon:yes stop_codon:yes gene_type:complete